MITLLIAASLMLGACADGTIPSNLPENLEGLESVEVELSGEGSSVSVDEIEVSGVVSMISDSSWTIAGQTFLLNSQTEIKGSLQAGDIVKVHAYLGDGGEVFAREIEPAEDEDDSDSEDDDSFDNELTELDENGNEIELVGTVESMSDSTWTVSNREIVITPETEIKAAIADGNLVKVHALFVDGEGLVAREIEPAKADDLDEDDMDDDGDLKYEGFVESINEESVVIDGTTFYFADFTEFEDEINIGDLVEIYFLDQDGTNVVREIELENIGDDGPVDMNDDDLDDVEDDDDQDDDDGFDHDDSDDDDDEEDDDHDDDDHDEEDDDNDEEEDD
jgi:hypothetical protein